ncbi:MAG TPA: hypothetical protein VLA12_15470 [Planctomycetaceae bacterium]|nr:hypothetical protein [Planctomycetaceae bacterium]
MPQSELLNRAVTVLEGAGIPYMVTGSLASSAQGEPRSTHDIDLVVDLNVGQINTLLAAFPAPEYYLSEASIQEAIRDRRMFNLLELSTGDKIDFWIVTDDEYDQTRFARRIKDEIDGIIVDVSTPEDTILMKLRWAKSSGGSEKQYHDALRVYEVQSQLLDTAYMLQWVAKLEVKGLWERIVSEAEPI